VVIALALKISNTTYLLKTLIVCLIALTILRYSCRQREMRESGYLKEHKRTLSLKNENICQ